MDIQTAERAKKKAEKEEAERLKKDEAERLKKIEEDKKLLDAQKPKQPEAGEAVKEDDTAVDGPKSLEDLFASNKTEFAKKSNIIQLYKEVLKENQYSEAETDYVIKLIYQSKNSGYGDIEETYHASKYTKKTYADYKTSVSKYLTARFKQGSISKALKDLEDQQRETTFNANASQLYADDQKRKEDEAKIKQDILKNSGNEYVLKVYESAPEIPDDLYKLNLQVLAKASEDDIVTALSKAIPTKERGGLNDSKKANLIERLLILRIAKEIESDETVVKSFFDTILSKKNIGQYQYSSNKSLYSALNANTVVKAKENILSFIPKLKKKVEQDIARVKLLGK